MRASLDKCSLDKYPLYAAPLWMLGALIGLCPALV